MSEQASEDKAVKTKGSVLPLGVVPMMMGVVLIGALAGAALAWVFLPDLMAASAIGGGMMFGAVRVFAYLFAEPAVLMTDTKSDGSDAS